MTDGTHEDEANAVSGGQNERLVIPPTPLGSWKGSMAFGVILFLLMVVEILIGTTSEAFLLFVAGSGWMGWGIQEWEHTKDYKIDGV